MTIRPPQGRNQPGELIKAGTTRDRFDPGYTLLTDPQQAAERLLGQPP